MRKSAYDYNLWLATTLQPATNPQQIVQIKFGLYPADGVVWRHPHICRHARFKRNQTIRGRVIAILLIKVGRRPQSLIFEGDPLSAYTPLPPNRQLVESLAAWMRANWLQFNTEKTEFLFHIGAATKYQPNSWSLTTLRCPVSTKNTTWASI